MQDAAERAGNRRDGHGEDASAWTAALCLVGEPSTFAWSSGPYQGKRQPNLPSACVEDLLILPPLRRNASTEWQPIQWEVIRETIRQNSLIYGPLSLSQQLPHLITARLIYGCHQPYSRRGRWCLPLPPSPCVSNPASLPACVTERRA